MAKLTRYQMWLRWAGLPENPDSDLILAVRRASKGNEGFFSLWNEERLREWAGESDRSERQKAAQWPLGTPLYQWKLVEKGGAEAYDAWLAEWVRTHECPRRIGKAIEDFTRGAVAEA